MFETNTLIVTGTVWNGKPMGLCTNEDKFSDKTKY